MNKIDFKSFNWTTYEPHFDNNETKRDFLDNHLFGMGDEVDIILEDGTYAEVEIDGVLFGLYASGRGDSYNHKVEFEEL